MGAPDVAGVRQLLLQIEEHEHALSSSAFVGALEGAEPAAVAQARVRAQDDFARLKLNLLEQETKKRLLEQLLSNGGVGQSAEIVARAEAQMVEREAAAKAARAESVEIRERLVEHTCAIADAKRVLAREGSALLALVSSGESGTQRAVDAKALLLEREQALERLCLRRVAEEKAAELAASELAQLQAQLERKQAKLAQLGAQVQAARDEVAQAEIKLQSTLEQQAHSSKATADAVWCASKRQGEQARGRAREHASAALSRTRAPASVQCVTRSRAPSHSPPCPAQAPARGRRGRCARRRARRGVGGRMRARRMRRRLDGAYARAERAQGCQRRTAGARRRARAQGGL
jgi:hypothetical protein